jgi:hypothetical protein
MFAVPWLEVLVEGCGGSMEILIKVWEKMVVWKDRDTVALVCVTLIRYGTGAILLHDSLAS